MKLIPRPAWLSVVTSVFLVGGVLEIGHAITELRTSGDSDTARQWVTSQYVRAGKNPYPIALAALEATYGRLAPSGPVHLKETPIYEIPRISPDPNTESRIGPPEATYPPTAALVFAATIGMLDRQSALNASLALNLVLIILLARELGLLVGWHSKMQFLVLLSITMIWPPTASCLERDQFSLLSVWAVMVAFRLQEEHPVLSGLFYSLALLKPSIAIPFLLLPLVTRRWRVLGTVALAQGGLLAASAFILQTMPWITLRQWVSVAAYFRQGMYTLQDFINGAHLDGSWVDRVLLFLLLAGAFPIIQRLSNRTALVFVSFLTAFWMYHGPYDLVVLLIAVPILLVTTAPSRIVLAVAIGALGIALVPAVYFGESAVARAIRWTARISVIVGVVISPTLDLAHRRGW